jgi:hypothetical protein
MVRIRLNLECDQCGDPFPHCDVNPAPVDGAIIPAPILRQEAKKYGWTRRKVGADFRDLCPRCATPTRHSTGANERGA